MTLPAELASAFSLKGHQSNKPVHVLASTLPSGIDEKGKRTAIRAGDLTTMFTTVMQDPQHQDLVQWNLMSQDVEINGITLPPPRTRVHLHPDSTAGI